MTVHYPWPTFASPLQCRISDIRLDGEPLPPHLVDDDHLRIRLDRATDWRSFDCDVTVTTDEAAPAGVERFHSYVLVSSTRTNARLPFRLGDRQGGQAAGHLTVARTAVAGSFTLQAHAGGHVAGRLRAVGAGDPWTVVLEHREAPVPPGTPPFAIAWVDFADPGAPSAARENPAAHALMDLTHEPRLLLNSGVAGLQALLHNEHAKLERRRVRDILSSSIARYATATLFRAAASEVAAYDGQPQPPSSAVLRQTCEAVADHMPGIGSVDDLYEQLAAATGSPLTDAELWTRIDLAIGELTGATGALSTAAQEVAYG